jgi:hypothetical protein
MRPSPCQWSFDIIEFDATTAQLSATQQSILMFENMEWLDWPQFYTRSRRSVIQRTISEFSRRLSTTHELQRAPERG